jgi:two-component system sensor histidine kinase PilS (NtrC family)
MEIDDRIAPCPFSEHYRIPARQAWQLLTGFLLYRLVLGSVLVFPFFFAAPPALLGKHDPALYAVVSSLYLGTNLLAMITLLLRWPAYSFQAQLQIFADITLIPIIMHASGGIGSGIGILLALSVAAGGILVGGRCALLFAALASLAVLGEQVYADLGGAFPNTAYTYGGMLGGAFFAIAILAMALARRAELSEAIAAQRGIALANLQQLNEHIIQHLQSGILIVDAQQTIRMLNQAAQQLVGREAIGQSLTLICPQLAKHFQTWLAEPARNAANLDVRGANPVHVRFSHLSNTLLHMIFLEDNALYLERVQQSKLASLGRLTASIAHEIRNPLSVIGHASQLLAECRELGPQDRRLTQIIHDHVARVNSIVENVLQISRRSPSQRENLDLSPWLSKFLHDFELAHPERQAASALRVVVETDGAKAAVDPSHLKQILENLCTNALKYGHPEKGPITVRVNRHPRSGTPCVEVVDHGEGIDAQTVQQMFEPFFTTSRTGTGLGLYIARELAELNQARLEYETTSAGGCFRLCLADAEKTVIEL